MKKMHILSLCVTACMAAYAIAAPVTVIDENFEDDTVGVLPGNSGSIGSWVPNQWQSTPYYDTNNISPDTNWQMEVHNGGVGGSKGAYEDNIHRGFWGVGATSGPLQEFARDGFIQATAPAATPGDVVHGYVDIKYRDGIVAFGLARNIANMAAATNQSIPSLTTPGPTFNAFAANPDAALVLAFGDGYEGGEKLDAWVGGTRVRLDPDPANPYVFNRFEFQYTVGSSVLDYLKINGNPVLIQTGEPGAGGQVPLNVAGGIDGFFFSDRKLATDYTIDNVFMEVTSVPEPAAGLAFVGVASLLLRRRNQA